MQERKLSDESTLPLSFICLSRKRLRRSYLTLIFKCALAIWLRSLTIEISDVPCTGETQCQLIAKKAGNRQLTLFGIHRRGKLR